MSDQTEWARPPTIVERIERQGVACTERKSHCRCSLDVHDGPHRCNCGGAWLGDDMHAVPGEPDTYSDEPLSLDVQAEWVARRRAGVPPTVMCEVINPPLFSVPRFLPVPPAQEER